MLAGATLRRSPHLRLKHGRLLRQIPGDVRACLSREQLDRLVAAIAPQGGNHGVAIRASFHWITGRYFIALIAGRERRSDNRLRAEGHNVVPVSATLLIFMLLMLLYGVLPLAFLLYIVKSALRINLMDAPSPFHSWLCG